MSATAPGDNSPISHRPVPETPYREEPGKGEPPPPQAGDPRLEAIKEKLKVAAPYVGYSTFFVFTLMLFIYWTFPWDRVRDKIVAEFEKSQHVPPGGSKQVLAIGKLEPSWFTGVVLKDVSLTTIPSDPTKPASTLRAEEIKVRIALSSLLSSAKDMTFSAKALGGTIEGSVTHKATVAKDADKPGAKKDPASRYDRFIKIELEGLSLNDIAPLRDAIGVPVTGTLKGSIDITLEQSRADHASGTITFDIEGFCLPGDKSPKACPTGDPEKEGKVHFKVPALKAVFGNDDFPLPPVKIGNVPIQVSVKSGVARFVKMEAKGGDVDLNVDGAITFHEVVNESDVSLGLRFKFNDSYKKKGESTAGLLMALESEPKLRAGKRPDGFYSLRVAGPLGGNLQVLSGLPGTPHMSPGGGLTFPHGP
jgi:type II secretion system protein N